MPIDEKSIKRFGISPALIVFIVCLIVGELVVIWHAGRHGDQAREMATMHAKVAVQSIASQIQQATSAAETLAILSRQNNGPIPNFPKVAAEILQSRPALAYLELQPNGVVSDIFPMTPGAIGFNVLNDPASREDAYAAMQTRQLTISSVQSLYSKERGLIVRVPVFVKARDGRDVPWGFVAASLRWPVAISQARFPDLERQHYDYLFYTAASAQQKSLRVAGNLPSLDNAKTESVRIANTEFKLALKIQGGWVSTVRVIFEALLALIPATILGLLVNLLEHREALETSLNETKQRLSREVSQRQHAIDECQNTRDEAATIQTELKQTHNARLEAETKYAEFQAKLMTLNEAKEAALAKLKQTEAAVSDLQARLDGSYRETEKVVQARKAEREEARATIDQAQKTITEMKSRLDDAVSTDKKALSAAQSQLGTAQATIIDLQGRLDAATRSGKESAEANAAKLKQAEKKIAALEERLQVAEEADSKVVGLTALLEQSQADLIAMQSAKQTAPEIAAPQDEVEVAQIIQEPPPEPQVEPEPEPEPVVEPPAVVEAPAQPEPVELPVLAAEPEPPKPVKRKKVRRDDQMDFFSDPPAVQAAPLTPEPQPELVEAAEEPAEVEKPARKLPPPPPLDETEFRKAVHEMLPLLADRDPGAKDCLKANRNTYRSGFSAEAYDEFERAVKGGDYNNALELLKKAGRRHGAQV
jgi:hypothetical protein